MKIWESQQIAVATSMQSCVLVVKATQKTATLSLSHMEPAESKEEGAERHKGVTSVIKSSGESILRAKATVS